MELLLLTVYNPGTCIRFVYLFHLHVSIEGKAGNNPDGIIAIDSVYLYKICLQVCIEGIKRGWSRWYYCY